MNFSVIHLINQIFGPESTAVMECNSPPPPPVQLKEVEWHAVHDSSVPANNDMSDAEKEGSSRATPETPNNNEEVQEQATTDCQIGASPSAPCLQTEGENLGATADSDALIMSNAEKKGSSRATTPKASNNYEEVQEQAIADCQIGASPSAPCLQINGEMLGATADSDALIMSDSEKEGSSQATTPKASNNSKFQEHATTDYIEEFQMQAASERNVYIEAMSPVAQYNNLESPMLNTFLSPIMMYNLPKS
jgi:hypothetical protein